jgi:hypothetical protein
LVLLALIVVHLGALALSIVAGVKGGEGVLYRYPLTLLVNASRAPGEWQSYDVIWEGPRWDAEGKLEKKAYVTVLHNGVVVHHRRELHGFVQHKTVGDYKQRREKGPIELYEHGNPVRFRNIWIRPLGEYDK